MREHIHMALQKVPVLEPIKAETQDYYERTARERKVYIWFGVLDFVLLVCTIAFYTFMARRKEDCFASKGVDVPFNQ